MDNYLKIRREIYHKFCYPEEGKRIYSYYPIYTLTILFLDPKTVRFDFIPYKNIAFSRTIELSRHNMALIETSIDAKPLHQQLLRLEEMNNQINTTSLLHSYLTTAERKI